MATAVTFLTDGEGGDTGNPYVTASVSPSADSTMLLCVTNRDVGDASPPIVTGGGLTWTEIVEVHHDQSGTNSFMYIFRAETGSSPGSFSATITYNAQPAVGNIWQFCEITETDLTIDNALVQTATAFTDADVSSETTTFDTTPATDGIIFSYCSFEDATQRVFTADLGFTTLFVTVPARGEQTSTQYEIGGSPDTGVAAAWVDGFGKIGMISLEIKAGGAAQTMSVYDGAQFVLGTPNVYDGAQWVPTVPRVFDGAAWIPT